MNDPKTHAPAEMIGLILRSLFGFGVDGTYCMVNLGISQHDGKHVSVLPTVVASSTIEDDAWKLMYLLWCTQNVTSSNEFYI